MIKFFKDIQDLDKHISAHPKPKKISSLAVVVVFAGKALLVYHIGDDADYWCSEVGSDDFLSRIVGDDPVRDGIYLWRGHIRSIYDYWGEHDEELYCDEWRLCTAEEWAHICNDEHPGNDEELAELHAR